MTPTLRPVDAQPPERQGNYAFRWFVTPEEGWPEFLDLCARAWPGFEAAYDSSGPRPLALYRRSDRGRRRRLPAGGLELDECEDFLSHGFRPS